MLTKVELEKIEVLCEEFYMQGLDMGIQSMMQNLIGLKNISKNSTFPAHLTNLEKILEEFVIPFMRQQEKEIPKIIKKSIEKAEKDPIYLSLKNKIFCDLGLTS